MIRRVMRAVLFTAVWIAYWTADPVLIPPPPIQQNIFANLFEQGKYALQTRNRDVIFSLLSQEVLEEYTPETRIFFLEMMKWNYPLQIAQATLDESIRHSTPINGKEAATLIILIPNEAPLRLLLLKEYGGWKICFPCDRYQSMGIQTVPEVIQQ